MTSRVTRASADAATAGDAGLTRDAVAAPAEVTFGWNSPLVGMEMVDLSISCYRSDRDAVRRQSCRFPFHLRRSGWELALAS